jgi:pimeloyl-ACP methyl ester carboxylesterase
MRTLPVAALAALVVLLGGCSGSTSKGSPNAPGPTDPTSGNGAPSTTPSTAFRAAFQPGQGVLPFPSDLYLNGSGDGTVNAPALALTPNVVSANALDGFSVNAPISFKFTAPVDATTLALPGAVTVLETTMATIATPTTVARVPIAVRRPLVPGVDYSIGLSTAADAGSQVVTITPLKPLTPSAGGVMAQLPAGVPPGTVDVGGVGYLVIVTGAVKSAAGDAAVADSDYDGLKKVIVGAGTPSAANCAVLTDATQNGLCQQLAPQLLIAAGAQIPLSSVALTFSFTTLATKDVLLGMATAVQNLATPPQLIVQQVFVPGTQIPLTTKLALDPQNQNPALHGIADIYAGTITLPYFLPTPADASATNPAPPLTGQFLSAAPFTLLPGTDCTTTPTPAACTRYVTRYNPVPAKTHDVTIPVLMTVPNTTTKPAGGWPVVIFVHGITRNRADALAIAEAYASVGFAVVAIDQPLHGITPTDPAAAFRIPGVPERTFDVDYVNNQTLQPPGDGVVDPSGANFIQVASPVTSRDNLRQSAIDVLTLAKSLPTALAVDGTVPRPGPLFDGTKIHLSGQSLGAMVGTLAAAQPSALKSAALSVPGGGIVRLLLDSQTFGPPISAGVAAQLGPNTLLFNAFFRDAQAAVDAADPVNFAKAAVQARPVIVQEVLGDRVIPNSATDRLVAAGGLNKVSGVAPYCQGGGPFLCAPGSWVKLTQGSHGSLLDPTSSLLATVEMQTEFASFVYGAGAGFQITHPEILEP